MKFFIKRHNVVLELSARQPLPCARLSLLPDSFVPF